MGCRGAAVREGRPPLGPGRVDGAAGPAYVPGVNPSREELDRRVDALVDACRADCLWFLRPDYHPRSDEERLRVLEAIQRHAGLDAYREAARLKRWLSPASSATSAGC